MGSTRHEKSFVDYEQPYEQNIIGMKGIVYFGLGLFMLIVITFGLMWALLNVLEDQKVEELRQEANPMAMSERDRLPPEPRLQLAPGFGVEGPNGKVNLELMAPQAEYWQLQKQWKEIWDHGIKDPHSGAVTAIGINEAKEKFLGQQVKARTGIEAEQEVLRSKMYYSDASSGRVASERRR
ncbi:MAG TPA: hypothetical protein VFZ23_15610 [Pyrinomonadaceae bacterium]